MTKIKQVIKAQVVNPKYKGMKRSMAFVDLVKLNKEKGRNK